MKTLCIIPARGGSKGIPRKNVKLIAGKPLLAHSILQARQTPGIARVVVSTDDEEIAAVSCEWGAEVVPRPPEISGDTASSESALLHTLDYLKEKDGYEPDLVVFLQATSPRRSPGAIQTAIDTLNRENADSLLSVNPLNGFVWRVEKDGSVRSFSYDYRHRPRRQDAPEDLIDNGSIYIFKPWVLRQFNNRLGGKIALYRMSALDSFQIDEPGDFELIEQLMAYRATKDHGPRTAEEGPRTTDHGPVSSQRSVVSGQSSVVVAQKSGVSGQWSLIKLLVLDFDGVMTDNRVLVTEDGTEAVFCNRGDGLGLGMLKRAGIEVVVISKEKNPVVGARCRKLGIECIQGCDDKLEALKRKAEKGLRTTDHGPRTTDLPRGQKSEVSGQSSVVSRQPSSVSGQWSVVSGLKAAEIAYVGNDINDLECMRWAGLPIAVADAEPAVLSAAKWVTQRPGGHGAVREICDLLLKSQNVC